MKKTTLTLLLAAITLCSQAQHRLSLTEAQEYAISNNLTVRNTNLDLEKAERKIWETAAEGLPQLSASGTYQLQITKIPELMFQPGQSVKLGLPNTFNASASLTQLIFNGSYLVGLRAAKTYKHFAELGVEKSVIEIRAAVAECYYLALLADESTSILSENLQQIQKTFNELRAMKEQGLIDRTSLDQIEVNYNQVLAQFNASQRQIKNTLDMLKYIIGMPLTEQVELSDDLVTIVQRVSPDYLRLDGYNQNENIDIKMSAMGVTLSELSLSLAKTAYMPTLAAQLGLQHNFTMPEFSFQNATTSYLGVALNVPLFTSGKTRAKVQQAKIELEQSKNKDLLARQELDLAFQSTMSAFQLAWDNYEVQKKNLALASRVLSDMKKSITVGMKSSTELIQANTSYLQAASGMLTSEFELLKAKIDLDKILSRK